MQKRRLIGRTFLDLLDEVLGDEADIVENRREQVVEVMNDTTGDLIQGLELLQLPPLPLQLIAFESGHEPSALLDRATLATALT